MEAYWQHREAQTLEQLQASQNERTNAVYVELIAHYRSLASVCARSERPSPKPSGTVAA
jgi:hypothetical protein